MIEDYFNRPRSKIIFAIVEIILWAAGLAVIAWLWDRWMLEVPHGPYHWVGMDFAPFWSGVGEMFHGTNPYSNETTLKIQQVVYGGTAMGNDPMMFVYPAWIFLLIAPFALLPFKVAAILYTGTLLWVMLNLLFLIARNLSNGNFRSQSLWMLWLTFGSLPFLIISVTKGQVGYLSLGALFLSRRIWVQRPWLAGIILGLALIKPTVTVIPVAGFLVWALLQKEWKIILGFIGCMSLLSVASFLAAGNWLPGYFSMLSTTGGMPVLWSLAILPVPWRFLYAGFFMGLLIYSIIHSLRDKNRNPWFSATIVAGIALTPMRWVYDLFLGIIVPSEERWTGRFHTPGVGMAIGAPWMLIFLPETIRWNTAVIGLPLIWALGFIIFYQHRLFQQPVNNNKHETIS